MRPAAEEIKERVVRVEANFGRCEGYANCIVAAPDVFELDEEFIVRVVIERPEESRRAEVQEAVRNCPVAALVVVED